MPKLTLTDLTSLTNQTSAISTINANNALIEALAELLVSRDGTAPNTMTADLDINSKKLLNVASGTAAADGVNYAQLTAATGQVPGNSMLWETATADSDQGAGKVWGNAATASITILYVDDADVPGADISTWVQTWDNSTNSSSRGYITVVQKADGDNYAIFEVDGAVTDASGYTKIPVNYIVGDGTLADADAISVHFTRTGDVGTDGKDPFPTFTFDSSTTMGDPGAGDFRLNNATLASVTSMAIDATTSQTGNPDLSDYIATWDDSTSTIKGHLLIAKEAESANFAWYTISAVTDNTGWLQVTLTHVDSAGSFSNTDSCNVGFIRTGDKGDTGSTGSTGATGATGSVGGGIPMAWESTTTDTDQGAAKVWLNHGTASSATVFYIDDVEDGGANINTLVDSWDDSTHSAIKGTLKISKNSDVSNFHIYNISGTVVSASTYSKIGVTHVVSNGTISDADEVSVFFTRSGDDGSGALDNIVEDTTPQLGGDLDCNSSQIQWSKGADVASATALAVLTDGNYFDVTGTTTITSINTTGGPGTLIKLHFDGVVTLTHHSTDLILAGATNFTTEAGDELEFVEYASGDYRMTGWSLAGTAPGGGGGGAFLGEGASGASVGDSGDIIRVNQQTLDTSQTMVATDNGSAAGPVAIASGVTLTISSGATFTVI